MKISEIYAYPIKSFRGVSLPAATLTPHGLPYDRRFMLVRDHYEDSKGPKGTRYEPMAVVKYTEMCLFTTALTPPPPASGEPTSTEVEITYHDPESKSTERLKVPLAPDTDTLEEMDVSLHQSGTSTFHMGEEYSDWFSHIFGFDVLFLYIGRHRRTVLGNLAPNALARNQERKQQQEKGSGAKSSAASWISSIVNSMPGMPTVFSSGDGSAKDGDYDEEDYMIGFADVAAYLVVSETSLTNVSERLPEGEEMDITKFRPNIILSGAEEAFEEDFWGEICITRSAASTTDKPTDEEDDEIQEEATGTNQTRTKLQLTANCCRCASINVDYNTGKPGTSAAGQALKKLQSDRRVDSGHKYAPVFGRYAFLPYSATVTADGEQRRPVVSVGDEVNVTKLNEERTIFKWPGIGSTPKTELYAI